MAAPDRVPDDTGPEDGAGTNEEPEYLVVGQITKPHGTKGEVFVWPLTEDPETIFAESAEVLLGDEDGRLGDELSKLVVEGSRPFKRGVLVRWEGFADRTAVTHLAGRYLLLPREALAPLEEGEFFYHQLLGLEVSTADGTRVGRVREVFETEPAHLLEVRDGDRLHLIPFVERIIVQLDLESRQLVIEPPPGLLDL